MAAQATHGGILSTGIRGLDTVLGGGLRENRIYLIEGASGTGKTTLALHFLLDGVQHGERCLHVSLSDSERDLYVVAEGHGWSLDGIDTCGLAPSPANLSDEGGYTIFHPAEIELSGVTGKILRAVEEVNPRRVVIDSLVDLDLMSEEPARFRRQLLALKQFLLERGCTVLLLATAGINDPSQVRTITHGVIALRSSSGDPDDGYGPERRRLRILKMCNDNYQRGDHDYRVDAPGIQVYPDITLPQETLPLDGSALSSGDPQLDAFLGGGLERGSCTLITGPVGAGKTTLAAQFMLAAAQRGEPAAIFGFDEPPATFLSRDAAFDMDLRPLVSAGKIYLQHHDPASLGIGELTHNISLRVEHDGCRLLVIDGLNAFLRAQPAAAGTQHRLRRLLTYLGRHGVTTLLLMTDQLIRPSRAPTLDLCSIADAVVILRCEQSRDRLHRIISVPKNRNLTDGPVSHRFELAAHGFRLGHPAPQHASTFAAAPEEAT